MKKPPIILMSDYGLKEKFVSCLKGVIYSVDPEIRVFDLTHDIEPFNIWQASYALATAINYWPEDSIFISIVDPGVGTARKSLAVKTTNGRIIITPDNGTLTLTEELIGLVDLIEIDETKHRLPGSEKFETFHGRDVYAYVGARIASGKLKFQNSGNELETILIKLNYSEPKKINDQIVSGQIFGVEYPFGNVNTNIPTTMIEEMGLNAYNNQSVKVVIAKNDVKVFDNNIPFVKSFGIVDEDMPLIYPDSSGMVGLSVNQGSFADHFGIQGGENWKIIVEKI